MIAVAATIRAQAPAQIGAAVDDAVAWERNQAAASAEMELGDFRAVAIVSPAESWYEWSAAGLALHEPAPGTVHVKVILRDMKDGRTVPGLSVRGTFIAGDRGDSIEKPMPFGWYPAVNGYGENFPATEAGLYHLRLEIKPAAFARHDHDLGRRYTELLHGEFRAIKLDPAAMRGHEPLADMTEGARFARAQGAAWDRLLNQARVHAVSGGEADSGDYRVAYLVQPLEGYWYLEQGSLQYRTPAQAGDQNTEIRAVVRDSRSGRFLPGLDVRVTVRDGAGASLGTAPEPFMWDPVLSHYGENWRIPRTGQYGLTIRVDAPEWRRYGKQAGRRFASNGAVEFSGVRMESSPGR